jgi:hypothetical protein
MASNIKKTLFWAKRTQEEEKIGKEEEEKFANFLHWNFSAHTLWEIRTLFCWSMSMLYDSLLMCAALNWHDDDESKAAFLWLTLFFVLKFISYFINVRISDAGVFDWCLRGEEIKMIASFFAYSRRHTLRDKLMRTEKNIITKKYFSVSANFHFLVAIVQTLTTTMI